MTNEEKAEDYDRLQYEFTQVNQDLKNEKRANKKLTKQLALYGVVVLKGTFCECEAPLIRTGNNTNGYCGRCGKDLN